MDFPPQPPAIVQIVEKQDCNRIADAKTEEYKYSQEFYDFLNKFECFKNKIDYFEKFYPEDKREIEIDMLNLPYEFKVEGEHPVPDEVIKFIQDDQVVGIARYDRVRYEKEWNGYKVYIPYYSRVRYIVGGFPNCVLEKDGEIRSAIFDEYFEIFPEERLRFKNVSH